MTTKNSCTEYVHADVTIHFPADEAGCALCPFLETYSRWQCRLTGEYLSKGYIIGGFCPLRFRTDKEIDNV